MGRAEYCDELRHNMTKVEGWTGEEVRVWSYALQV